VLRFLGEIFQLFQVNVTTG